MGADGPEVVRDRRRRHDGGSGARGRRARLADRVRQRRQPDRRARHQPPP